ncbi:MAG: hypothetical protein EHM55_16540 [Acidobacteria bacterium]|nr:MAG: hypothetical protein EHM55_16540 [Acidobacteriota bacterium]
MRLNNRFLSTRAATFLLAVSLVGSLSAQTQTHPTTNAVGADWSRVDIKNFGRINANYYRGAQPKGRDYANLASLGVKTVIDLQADFEVYNEEQLVRAAGMQFTRIPMTTRVEPTTEQVDQFLKLVNDPAAQPVYVHCKGGRHRTGVMTAVYRMTMDGWNPDQAFREMNDFDFGWDFLHPEFKKYVYAYPRRLLEMAANRVPANLN